MGRFVRGYRFNRRNKSQKKRVCLGSKVPPGTFYSTCFLELCSPRFALPEYASLRGESVHEATSNGAQVDKLIAEAKADDERCKFRIAIYWLLLGAACAAMVWPLLTILVK